MSTSIEYYLNKREKCYSTLTRSYAYSRYVKHQDIIDWYLEARHVEKIELTFYEFESFVKKKLGTYIYLYKRRRIGHRYTAKNSFRNNKHQKKELSEKEINKREWKKKKKNRKDQSQRRYSSGSKHFVKYGRSSERREMKVKLQNKDWENGYWDDFIQKDRNEFSNMYDFY